MKPYGAPGTPGLSTLRCAGAVVYAEEHKVFRNGVGMLIFLVKYSRPDIANAIRELSKAMPSPSPVAVKELMRVLKFVIDTKSLGFKMKPVGEFGSWKLLAFSDSDYAGDPENRVSVCGYVIYLNEVPISWKSKGQKTVTMSSSEAEFVAMSEASKEIKFVYQVLESMEITVDLPIIVRVDNIGAIFMGENVHVSNRSKHIDVRYHFVREFVHDGFIRIIFVRSENNDADLFTKNLSCDLYKKHSQKLVSEKGK